jgi:hypothetical protein
MMHYPRRSDFNTADLDALIWDAENTLETLQIKRQHIVAEHVQALIDDAPVPASCFNHRGIRLSYFERAVLLGLKIVPKFTKLREPTSEARWGVGLYTPGFLNFDPGDNPRLDPEYLGNDAPGGFGPSKQAAWDCFFSDDPYFSLHLALQRLANKGKGWWWTPEEREAVIAACHRVKLPEMEDVEVKS